MNRLAGPAFLFVLTGVFVASLASAQDNPRVKEAASLPTPKAPDGRPDLSGFWEPARASAGPSGGFNNTPDSASEIRVFGEGADVATVNARMRAAVVSRRANTKLRPQYKRAEDARKALSNFDGGDLADPTYGCQLQGVTRLGLPSEIFQRSDAVVLLYEGLVNRYRVVPTDGRTPPKNAEPLVMGHPVGRWEGDTLVIETTGFIENNWIDRDGSFHSAELRVIERIRRSGNTLQYVVVAEDPIFVAPFKVTEQVLVLGKPDAHVAEEYPCIEHSIDNMVNSEKH